LGEGGPSDTYLHIDKLIDIAQQQGCEAIHPGYGFLSENTAFVERCEAANLVFIGPTSEQISLFGQKHVARELAVAAQVPLLPGTALLSSPDEASQSASSIGYPVMLKSTAGGGGIGMKLCATEDELRDAFASVQRLGASNFANDGVFLEKAIVKARHIEVQMFGDGLGTVVSLGERDCSAQRRNQKVVEECPAPHLSDALRHTLCSTAERLLASVNYRNAGTVEFIVDADSEEYYFLEVNTRLQVEHGVTELVYGVDLVEWMVKQASGALPELLPLREALQPQGHALQVRLYAEDPYRNFQPCPGPLTHVEFPSGEGLRVDHWLESGIQIPADFDPMLAKLMACAPTRELALAKLRDALSQVTLFGSETNVSYLRALCDSDALQQGRMTTRFLDGFNHTPARMDVTRAGTMTTIQDLPGRVGYWSVGIPRMWTVEPIKAGQTLSIGKLKTVGARAYLCIAGGIQCPSYLGSRSTFTLGQFGGHNGAAIKTGDVLHLDSDSDTSTLVSGKKITPDEQPQIEHHWTLRVMHGPHSAPDFFTPHDITMLFDTAWQVHYNSSRTGVRLIGPTPDWAREDGGEAGLHPSNIHDNAYAFGSVDFTGDMPVILGPDGPSLGGFVCPLTVISADLWKLGQLRAGDTLSFEALTIDQAVAAQEACASVAVRCD